MVEEGAPAPVSKPPRRPRRPHHGLDKLDRRAPVVEEGALAPVSKPPVRRAPTAPWSRQARPTSTGRLDRLDRRAPVGLDRLDRRAPVVEEGALAPVSKPPVRRAPTAPWSRQA